MVGLRKMAEQYWSDMPNYEKAVENKTSKKILKALGEKCGVASFAEIKRMTGLASGTLNYQLNEKLTSLNVIEGLAKGTYTLKHKAPFCWIFGKDVPLAYLGLLGKERERVPEPETKTALKLLEKEGYRPKLVYVVTTLDALNVWKGEIQFNGSIECQLNEIWDIDAIKNKARPQLEALLKDYVVIMDCTGLTKPATIAFYELATTYYLPLLYVYLDRQELHWLVSKEHLKRKLGYE